MKRHVTITATNATYINEPSSFAIHTSSSLGLIEEVYFRFRVDNFDAGLEFATKMVGILNKAIDEGIELTPLPKIKSDYRI